MKAELLDANLERMKREGKMGQRVVGTRERDREESKGQEIAVLRKSRE